MISIKTDEIKEQIQLGAENGQLTDAMLETLISTKLPQLQLHLSERSKHRDSELKRIEDEKINGNLG